MLILLGIFLAISAGEAPKAAEIIKKTLSFSPEKNRPLVFIVFLIMLARLLAHFFEIYLPAIAWDTVAYHYAIPQLYKEAGKIIYIPFMYHSNWPENIEMFYTFGLTAFNEYTANGISFIFSVMLATAAYAFGARFFNKNTGIITAGITVALTIFRTQAVNGQVENGLAFYEIAALYCLMLWLRQENSGLLVVGGILAGGAAATKILGLFAPALLFLTVLAGKRLYNRGDRTIRLKEALVFGAAALLACAAWYIKSWVDTGNPVWPFAYRIFGGKNWSQELASYRDTYYKAHGNGIGLRQFLMLPWTLIKSGNMDGYIGNNIFLYIALAPFLLFKIFKEKGKDTVFTALFFVIFVFFWFFTAQFVRFLLPAIILLTALNAYIIDWIWHRYNGDWRRKFMQGITVVYVIFLMLYSFPVRGWNDLKGAAIFAGTFQRETYLEEIVDCYRLMERANNDSQVKGRILLFKEIRGYYLKKDLCGQPCGPGADFVQKP